MAVKGHPEVTVSFDDLIKDGRQGVRTTRVTLGEERIEVEIAELLNGVEICFGVWGEFLDSSKKGRPS